MLAGALKEGFSPDTCRSLCSSGLRSSRLKPLLQGASDAWLVHCRRGFSLDIRRKSSAVPGSIVAAEAAPTKSLRQAGWVHCGRDFSPDCIPNRKIHRFARRD